MNKKAISVVIPTSLIPSHPSTAIIEETIEQARFHFPESQIVIMIDAVRPEQKQFEDRYIAYIHNLIGKALRKERGNIKLVPFGTFTHQAGMLRKTMEIIDTELFVFMEHDTPLVTDEPIEWELCARAILDGEVNLVRFLHEAEIHPEHAHLMCGMIFGRPLMRTIQFSARPHLTTKTFYRELLSHFSPEAKCFIEDKAHSICQGTWEDWKLSIYAPEGNKKRSYHTDGRAGGEKFSESQVF